MMRVSLGHRFLAIEANLPSPPKWEWEPTSTTVDRESRSWNKLGLCPPWAAPPERPWLGPPTRPANGAASPRIRFGRAQRSSPDAAISMEALTEDGPGPNNYWCLSKDKPICTITVRSKKRKVRCF